MAVMDRSPINAGFWMRLFTLLSFKYATTLRRLRKDNGPGGIVVVSARLCIKSTAFTRLAEAKAMQFVSQNTDVPVPKVHCAFEHKGSTYILMERIPGRSIAEGWVRRPEESKARILAQLREMVDKVRSIPPPEQVGVADVTGGPIFDQRLPKTSLCGPFERIADFHKALHFGIEAEDVHDAMEARRPGTREMIAFYDGDWQTPSFTHGDLSSLNILAQGDRVTGIVDWKTAGWMPSY